MKLMIVFTLFSLVSCSLLVPRKEHYSYIQKGTSKDEVIEKSGQPERREILAHGEWLVYGYCATPWWKEGVGAALTFGIYATTCNGSYYEMGMFFQDGNLVELRDNINQAQRDAQNRATANAFQNMGNQMNENDQRERDRRLIQQEMNKPVETNCTSQKDAFGAVRTNCKQGDAGFDSSLYNK
jgi:hypothetical protein